MLPDSNPLNNEKVVGEEPNDTPSAERFSFRCIEVRQPIGTFYIGAMSAAELVSIAWADIRRLEDRDLDEYLGFQRTLRDDRVRELEQYVRTVDATFPTSIILAIESKDAQFDDTRAVMSLPKQEGIARIIDGQHRIAGLKSLRSESFLVNVTLFIDMDIADQASVFSTINLAQTKVSPSLVYDLYAYAKARSPQKTAHYIARLMNKKDDSPFVRRIKVLGVATPGRKDETLTQATFVKELLPYITDREIKDRDDLKRGLELEVTPPHRQRELIFRELFRLNEDEDIALVIFNFFSAVRSRWPESWNRIEPGNVLNRTTGFVALMRLLRPAYNAFGVANAVPPISHFAAIFERIDLPDGGFTSDRYKPGGTGQSALANALTSQAGLS